MCSCRVSGLAWVVVVVLGWMRWKAEQGACSIIKYPVHGLEEGGTVQGGVHGEGWRGAV
jgi:hypothetical protein